MEPDLRSVIPIRAGIREAAGRPYGRRRMVNPVESAGILDALVASDEPAGRDVGSRGLESGIDEIMALRNLAARLRIGEHEAKVRSHWDVRLLEWRANHLRETIARRASTDPDTPETQLMTGLRLGIAAQLEELAEWIRQGLARRWKAQHELEFEFEGRRAVAHANPMRDSTFGIAPGKVRWVVELQGTPGSRVGPDCLDEPEIETIRRLRAWLAEVMGGGMVVAALIDLAGVREAAHRR